MAVRLLQAPNLRNPYKGWDMFANNIGQTSRNIINRADNNEYKANYFNYQKEKDNRDMFYKKGRDEKRDNQWQHQFDFDVMQQKKKELANTEVLKATRPDIYANIGQEYGSIPSIENANKMNAVTGNINAIGNIMFTEKNIIFTNNLDIEDIKVILIQRKEVVPSDEYSHILNSYGEIITLCAMAAKGNLKAIKHFKENAIDDFYSIIPEFKQEEVLSHVRRILDLKYPDKELKNADKTESN
ncbi:hypothetical protein Arnit_0617 [Arcobacter nitrofigilis DSM 7299]|uniref:Uncharacterized protein n=1 Tax=Arcobacter nitrofigilis (strain ATCC 33309 / DSM 7299 / CCUG 15893 / LMG 7604 / NCTC 12251 / CI) TaxID=572480 RepID=D5V249_ARCNC|nr:hypothetical protein [Arcobacter nitrofigilis]ADG92282.1 hypothetical protein Arnit_0617 [Arcobacter nitrofigilis DSM 7299]